MAEEYVVRRRPGVASDEEVVETPAGRTGVGWGVAQIVYFIGGLIELLLALRFVLQLFGANASNAFVNLIYSWSAPLVAPFFGMFATTPTTGVGRVEIETLVALLVYAFLTYLIARLLASI